MTAMSRKILEREPSELELLLPWHAAGTLNARDARRIDEALAGDLELGEQYAAIQEEYVETIRLNESLGAPSARAMQKLFAAIDQELARNPSASFNIAAGHGIFYAPITADPGLVGEPWRAGAAVAGGGDRRGADEESERLV